MEMKSDTDKYRTSNTKFVVGSAILNESDALSSTQEEDHIVCEYSAGISDESAFVSNVGNKLTRFRADNAYFENACFDI
uniref:Uncharacterized protein n=1 Tax=Heterorhabditis bacteriophora TaxID=37862 RepID=A0A1I7X826_HETBA